MMPTVRAWICCGLAFVAVVLPRESPQAEARPLHQKVWYDVYPGRRTTLEKCAICHFGERKSAWNDYGKAIKAALVVQKVTDEDAIRAALIQAEDKLPPSN